MGNAPTSKTPSPSTSIECVDPDLSTNKVDERLKIIMDQLHKLDSPKDIKFDNPYPNFYNDFNCAYLNKFVYFDKSKFPELVVLFRTVYDSLPNRFDAKKEVKEAVISLWIFACTISKFGWDWNRFKYVFIGACINLNIRLSKHYFHDFYPDPIYTKCTSQLQPSEELIDIIDDIRQGRNLTTKQILTIDSTHLFELILPFLNSASVLIEAIRFGNLVVVKHIIEKRGIGIYFKPPTTEYCSCLRRILHNFFTVIISLKWKSCTPLNLYLSSPVPKSIPFIEYLITSNMVHQDVYWRIMKAIARKYCEEKVFEYIKSNQSNFKSTNNNNYIKDILSALQIACTKKYLPVCILALSSLEQHLSDLNEYNISILLKLVPHAYFDVSIMEKMTSLALKLHINTAPSMIFETAVINNQIHVVVAMIMDAPKFLWTVEDKQRNLNNALHLSKYDSGLFRLLIEHKADVNSTDSNRNTLLHKLVMSFIEEECSVIFLPLLNNGFNAFSVRNCMGYTAVADSKTKTIFNYLISKTYPKELHEWDQKYECKICHVPISNLKGFEQHEMFRHGNSNTGHPLLDERFYSVWQTVFLHTTLIDTLNVIGVCYDFYHKFNNDKTLWQGWVYTLLRNSNKTLSSKLCKNCNILFSKNGPTMCKYHPGKLDTSTLVYSCCKGKSSSPLCMESAHEELVPFERFTLEGCRHIFLSLRREKCSKRNRKK